MSEIQTILERITALRQRLEKSRSLSHQMAAQGSEQAPDWLTCPSQVVAQRVEDEGEHDLVVDRTVQPVTGAILPPAPVARQLTARARRVLEQSRSLLGQLRAIADAFAPPYPEPAEPGTPASDYLFDFSHPLARRYRQTVAITDTALRMIPHFPDTATGQLHLCEGLESIINEVDDRLQILSAAVAQRQQQRGLLSQVAELLSGVERGLVNDLSLFRKLADRIVEEARRGEPLLFPAVAVTPLAPFVAAHSLTTARVIARIARHEPELKGRLHDAVLAALLHDVGMLRVPGEVLSHRGPLNAVPRQQVEKHCQVGATLLDPLAGEASWLIEAAASHQERMDGTGYPNGLRGGQVSVLTRLLAVCDCYASLCSPRPHRNASEPRTALADTLLLAEKGQLDPHQAEHLLQLSFYPVGSAVELADGAVGVVVAAPAVKSDLNVSSRPVVALLLDADRRPFPLPRYLDLARTDCNSIVRTLSLQERSETIGPRFPEWVAV